MASSKETRSLSTGDRRSTHARNSPSTSSMPGRIFKESKFLQIPAFFGKSASRSSSLLSCSSGSDSNSTDFLKEIAAQTPAIRADDEAAHSILSKINHEGIQHYPFCEEYDGVSVRKTKTISESIQAIIAEQKSSKEAKRTSDMAVGMSIDNLNRVPGKSSIIESKAGCGTSSCLPMCSGISEVEGPVSQDEVCADIEHIKLEAKRSHDSIQIAVQTNVSSIYAKEEQHGKYVGSVDIKIRYEIDRQSLQVTVIKAEDVFDKSNYNFIINPFVKLGICHRNQYMEKKRTRTVYRRRHPVFNEEIAISDISLRDLSVTQLLLQLYHKKRTGSKLLGDAYIWLEDINLSDGTEQFVTKMFSAI